MQKDIGNDCYRFNGLSLFFVVFYWFLCVCVVDVSTSSETRERSDGWVRDSFMYSFILSIVAKIKKLMGRARRGTGFAKSGSDSRPHEDTWIEISGRTVHSYNSNSKCEVQRKQTISYPNHSRFDDCCMVANTVHGTESETNHQHRYSPIHIFRL
jgi:hypothetical protein